jgi:hypothetical protein
MSFTDVLNTITDDFISAYKVVTQPAAIVPGAPPPSTKPPTTPGSLFAGVDFTTILLLAGVAILVIVLIMGRK